MLKKLSAGMAALWLGILLSSLSFAMSACRAKIDKPEGISPTGEKLDSSLPKDARFVNYFSALKVVDFSLAPRFKSCTEANYQADPTTGTFPAVPMSQETKTSLSYDSKGNITKEVVESGDNKTVTEWFYDDSGRLSKITDGTIESDGTTSIASTCVLSYDGTSERQTKQECYQGAAISEDTKNRIIEITYNLPQKKRTVETKERLIASEFRTVRKAAEEHADTDYSFIVNSTEEVFQFSTVTNENKITRSRTTESIFSNNKYAGYKLSEYIYQNGTAKIDSIRTCDFAEGHLNCKEEKYNSAGEIFRNEDSKYKPLLLKNLPATYYSCSLYSCDEPAPPKSNAGVLIEVSSTKTAVDGKLNSDGIAPAKFESEQATFQLSNPNFIFFTEKSASLEIDSGGKFVEENTITTVDNLKITSITQRRKESGAATSREALGEFQNQYKTEKSCSLN